MTIHLLTTTVVHSLLLFLKLPHLLADRHTLWDRTDRLLALLRMDTEQRPDALTNSTAALVLDLADTSMLQIVLHLGAICRGASSGGTARCMLDQLNV